MAGGLGDQYFRPAWVNPDEPWGRRGTCASSANTSEKLRDHSRGASCATLQSELALFGQSVRPHGHSAQMEVL